MKTVESTTSFNTFLFFSVFTVNLATLALGLVFGWSSPAIPRLNGSIEPENNPLPTPITSSQESWITSLVPLGSIFGAFVSGFISDKVGRKNTLLMSGVPFIIGFTLCAFPSNIYFFYFGRFSSGLGCGVLFTGIPVYVGEVSEKHNRGLLSCLFSLHITLGMLLVYVLSPYCAITTLCMLGLPVSILFMIIFGLFVPESPYYYVIKNEIDEARKSLLKMRCNNTNIVEAELLVIRKNIDDSCSKERGISDFFKDKCLLKSLMLMLILAAFQQFSGINTVVFYMQSIFQESGTALSSSLCTIIVGIVQCLSSMLASVTIDKFGRRVLLLSSAIGMAITLTVLSAYFCLKENAFDVHNFNTLPIIFINLYVSAYILGFDPVVFGIMGELFPVFAKSMASTLTICCCQSSMFIVATIFPYLKELSGMGSIFGVLAAICFLAGCFVYFKVPETKGKSLQEIEEMLRK